MHHSTKPKETVTVQLTSTVSYPKRDSRFGNYKYRGNCDGNLLKDLIQHYGALQVCDPMEGSGTSRDVCRWLKSNGMSKLQYTGHDLRKGFNLESEGLEPQSSDLVFIHPPYHNMIRYSDDPRDLSTCSTYEEFLERLTCCLEHCYKALVPSGRLAILVGDLRRKGVYTPIFRDVLSLEGRIGQLRSIIIKSQHNCQSNYKVYSGRFEDPRIMHEYCVIFKRPVF